LRGLLLVDAESLEDRAERVGEAERLVAGDPEGGGGRPRPGLDLSRRPAEGGIGAVDLAVEILRRSDCALEPEEQPIAAEERTGGVGERAAEAAEDAAAGDRAAHALSELAVCQTGGAGEVELFAFGDRDRAGEPAFRLGGEVRSRDLLARALLRGRTDLLVRGDLLAQPLVAAHSGGDLRVRRRLRLHLQLR